MKIWLLRSMTELTSRKWISKLTGAFAESRLSRYLIPMFARTYGINIDEAEKPINQYRTLNEFFTRRLKNGMRSIDQEQSALISPVDALITSCGPIDKGLLLNVKGQDYSISELLADEKQSKSYEHGYYMVLYLSPTDYHRIHAPAAGSIVGKVHLPGKVYPVNHFGLTHMKAVLSRNERLITYIKTEQCTVAAVKVGAMNVSSIFYVDPHKETVERGEELAYFAFGSTVVLLMETGTFEVDHAIKPNTKVRMGQRLGLLQRADSQ
ncbi:phosphatidylserine decarboxylase [Paenibacillus camelliae]|uniref:phosphatidylserine decarboxylase n=1 Tax=Paenibacillus camelliae TaxID=512410 RepID=UPI00203AB130|nr:phosphatidylserine decarboxylase [Paenibacillus camelliae]MCM3632533.1 phosphatidylserine decarboxylase [Paenibacillus camelliae]